jgi:alpha-L-fucosidase 2
MKQLVLAFCVTFLFSCIQDSKDDNTFKGTNLKFNELATGWDEAMPLGNGIVGQLVWQKDGKLRFSLDRVDLWDLRPMEYVDFEEWKFDDVYQHWKEDKYEKVQDAFDKPYTNYPAPTKIPAGAIEFDIDKLGKVESVELDIVKAICIVKWTNGVQLTTFVNAEDAIGWYKFENLSQEIDLDIKAPNYQTNSADDEYGHSKIDLNQLGYCQGEVIRNGNSISYNQNGWKNFSYQINTQWKQAEGELIGCWSISSSNKGWEKSPEANEVVAQQMKQGMETSLVKHLAWWKHYWSKSSINIPDSLLQKQYYMEMYKFGAIARADAPPISLQAVWTADNGKLPPWKGDFHHDLNTQLSYWPSYTGNYLELEEGFVNWLWKYRDNFKAYTKNFFNAKGLNVPGVTTLEGEPMGGWCQYSFGQTVSAWLGHHFYLHWQYTQDRRFLKERAYPWLKEVAIYLDDMSVKEDGQRKLKISSSPEIFDNKRKAWFEETTNFDLSLIRWTYEKSAELANELGLTEEAIKWRQILAEWPELSVDETLGLNFAPGFPCNVSHRHFSHLLGIHPLGIIDFSDGEESIKTINNSLTNLAKQGSDFWVGYSFSWQANLYARAFNGEKAAEALRIFAECFCLKNSFHVNGDQCKAGHSKFHYRPFTLEGNFAFASAIQEMLIQSHTGVVKLFPAIPDTWQDVSFEHLRTYGAFLVSANMKDGDVDQLTIKSDKGGKLILENPFSKNPFSCNKEYKQEGDKLIFILNEGESIQLLRK